MDEKPVEQDEAYIEFDTASLRAAPRFYGGAFQLSNDGYEIALTFGHRGASLPAEKGELNGKNFADAVVFITPETALRLRNSLHAMIEVLFKEVSDEDAE